MAISAAFVADFSSFVAAVDGAETKLVSFEGNANKVKDALGRMEDSLSGRKLIQDATLMVEALNRVQAAGGVTEAEYQRVALKAAEATEKMVAMGMVVPPVMQRVADRAKDAGEKTSFLDSTFARLTASFSAASLIDRAVGTVTAWGVAALESASQTVNLADKTGLSTKTIQEMGFVAGQTNTTVDAFTTAAFKLGVSLAGGSGSVRAAVKDLGLSFEDLRQMSPDAQFNAITRALETMESPQERNRLAVQLFGKAAADILPAIAQGYRTIADQANVSGDAQLRTLDSATNAWEHFKSSTSSAFVQFAGSALIAQQYLSTLGLRIAGVDVETLYFADAQDKAGAAVAAVVPHVVDYAARLNAAEAELAALSTTETEAAMTAKRLGATTEEITDTFGLSAEAQKLLAENITKTNKVQTDAAAATKKYDEAVAELDSSGKGWHGTLDAMNAEMVEAIAGYLDAGVSQAALATYYNLTATQIKAVASSLKEEDEIRKITDKSIVETMKLQHDYATMLVEQGGTSLDVRLAQIQQWADDEVAKLKDSDENWQAHYDQIQVNADKMRDGVLLNWDTIGRNTKRTLEQEAANAQATYEFLTRIDGEYSAARIAHAKEEMFASREKAKDYRQVEEDAIGGVSKAHADLVGEWEAGDKILHESVAETKSRMTDLTGSIKDAAFAARQLFGNSRTYDLSTDAGMAEFKQLNPMAQVNVDKSYFLEHTLADAIRAGLVDLYAGWLKAGGPMGFDGGVENFTGGLAYVHKDELLVNMPPGTDVLKAGGGRGGGVSVQNVFNIVDTESNIARRVSASVMRSILAGTQLN